MARQIAKRGGLQSLFSALGPGLVTGASDDDPSGIGTYASAGAAFGYATLWTAWMTFPLMTAVQYMCAKIGIASGVGLARALRRTYPRWWAGVAVAALCAANTLNAGADIGAMASAVTLLAPMNRLLILVSIPLVILAVQIAGSYRFVTRVFRWMTLILFAYIGAAFFAHPSPAQVLRGTFIPVVRLDAAFLSMLVAILGTTISPYLFFWQATHEAEETRPHSHVRPVGRWGVARRQMRYAAWDVGIGMLFSNVVMYFVILATGATLFAAGKTDIASAVEAAEALRPIAGDGARLLFGLGLIGSGLLAVPILTGSAAHALAEVLGWRAGLDERPARAPQFYAAIAAATLVGTTINFMGVNPIRALVWASVVNGLVAPPLLVLILRMANNPRVVGTRVNGRTLNILGWVTTAAMWAAAFALVWVWLARP
jgi:NRAMP (natural resistance-associated macrophage protein)-like metal ion transporter